MRSNHFLHICSILIISSVLLADTSLIRTTVADSSNVSFIVRTPLSWKPVEKDSLGYIRFVDSPVTDSIGYPELPMITCLVAVPDGVHPSIAYDFTVEYMQHVLPVYPTPAQIMFSDYCTPSLVDSFVQDSVAYTSASFWPAERVRLIGETRICDQRLLKIQLFPAQYRAADSTLSTVTSFSVSVSFDSTEANWSSIGLGAFQRMVEGSPIVGYSPVEQTHAPVPRYFGVVDPEAGPQYPYNRMPDYLIICASGLYAQCQAAIDDLAEHRVDLNGFDVATVLTDDILEDFGDNEQTVITDETIRDFTEYMWKNWPQASVKKPSYLLLIGDHEDPEYGSANWFLPTHIYDYIGEFSRVEDIGNDEWYTYMNDDPSINNDFPSMAVGRISIKNGGTPQTDTLSTIIANFIDMETPITQIPLQDNRRRITRLAGTGNDNGSGFQSYTSWDPSSAWTEEFSDWLGYEYTTNYCGDGRDFIDKDGSLMASWEWRERCLAEFENGAGVIFYTDHGDFHMFSAGLEWLRQYIPQDPFTKGARDSTFNCYQIANNLTTSNSHAAPFALLLCCSAGTYNHTLEEHEDASAEYPELCFFNGAEDPPVAAYNFGTDCLGESLLKNTTAPVAGVFCGSRSSWVGCYGTYGRGILEAIYAGGTGRLGDAIEYSRLNSADFSVTMNGDGIAGLGQFNLLGDPALDISDYVRYPNTCDIVVYQGDLDVSPYPVETSSGAEMELSFIVRNNGRQASGSFSTRITISNESDTSIDYLSCSDINPRTARTYQYTWVCPAWFDAPVELDITVEADWQHNCSDIWWTNNTASETIQINDIYPFNSGWPVETTGNVSANPILVNLDMDAHLEVVVHCGTSLTAYDYDGTKLWSIDNEGFSGTQQPLAADLDQDGDYEILVACEAGIKVVGNTGSVLNELETGTALFVVGDMHPRSGLELCTADNNVLTLYYWNTSSTPPGFAELASEDLGFSPPRLSKSLVCNDLDGDSYKDVAYLCGFSLSGVQPPPQVSSISVYNWYTEEMIYQHTWGEYLSGPVPYLSAGLLAGTATVGYPMGAYEGSGDPARLIEPDEAIEEVSCSSTNVLSANSLTYGVYADWNSLIPGTDTYVLPSNRQCMAWDVDGGRILGFPTSAFGGDTECSPISPTALGNLDGVGNADVLFATVLDGDWTLIGMNSGGDELDDVGFPYTLPEGVAAGSGFAVGDLDRDGKVEIVFGTDDGLLHCWELGSCTTGYAPWPQFQHDCGRSGALE